MQVGLDKRLVLYDFQQGLCRFFNLYYIV